MIAPGAPHVPAGIEWITDPADCAEVIARGVVPLAWPGEAQRAQRWAHVLHAYGEILNLTVPLEPDQRRWLISVGDTDHIGRAAATALGRTHHHVPDLHSVEAVEVPAGSSVLLVVPARQCTFAALHPLLARWSRDGTRIGVLTGLDQAGMIFSLAKILADCSATRPRPEEDIHLDGTTATARTSASRHPRLAEALACTWRNIVVDAHGTGSHATLGSYILCGLAGDRERLPEGSALVGGCTPGRCRACRGVLDQVLVRYLRCRVLGLFVCNAITLSPEEQFPSDVSLALAAVEGHPAATLGLLRQDADISGVEPAAALRLLASGLSYGTVASWLSDDAAARGFPTAYLLLGEPDHAQPVTGPVVEPVPWPEERQFRLPAVLDSDRQPVAVLLTRHGPIPPADPDGPLRIWDAAAETVTTVDALSNWVADTDEAAHLEDNLWALMTSKRKQVLTECLEQMSEHRQAARLLALRGLRNAQACRRRGQGAPDAVLHAELQDHVRQWATALSRTVQARTGAFRLWDALQACHHPHRTEIGASCPRCAAPRTLTELTSLVPGVADRISVTCPRCGPHAHYPTSEPVRAAAPAWLRPGGTAEITVALPNLPSTRTGDDGLVAVQIQARAGLAALDSASCTAGPGEHCRLTVSVPADLELDLHRLWVLWVHRFRVSLLQERVPTLPVAESSA